MSLGDACHLIVDLYGVDKKLLWDKKLTEKFLNSLPAKVGMTIIQKAKILDYKAANPLDSGLTGIVILAESHCSWHSFPERNLSFLDIFSCSSFNASDAMMYITETWEPEDAPYAVLKRGTDFNGERQGLQVDHAGLENDQVQQS